VVDPSGPSPPLARVSTPAPALSAQLLLAAGVLFLVLAVVKPWGAGTPAATRPGAGPLPDGAAVAGGMGGTAGGTGGTAGGTAGGTGGTAGAVAAAVSTPEAPSPGPGEIACSPGGWEIVSLDRLADWTVRTWIPATPIIAISPLDPAIEVIPLDSPTILSVGVCGPPAPSAGTTAMRIVSAWALAGQRATPISIETRQETGLDPRIARLYAPLTVGHDASWPGGRYVLEVAALASPGGGPLTGPSGARWFIGVSVRGSIPPG
jgi:hypothetical protein